MNLELSPVMKIHFSKLITDYQGVSHEVVSKSYNKGKNYFQLWIDVHPAGHNNRNGTVEYYVDQ
jgi:hypothetical protein